MDIRKADAVVSQAGRDKGRLFYVFEMIDEQFAFIADGKLRHIDKPKKKKLKHLAFYSDKQSVVLEKILSGEKITDAQLRKVLNQFEIPLG